MPDSSDKPLPAVGVFWIEEADYAAALATFDDGATLPPTWAAWLKMAEEMKKGLEAYGHPVMKVRIDPQDFPGLVCRARHDDGQARAQSIRRRGCEGAIRRARLSYGPQAAVAVRPQYRTSAIHPLRRARLHARASRQCACASIRPPLLLPPAIYLSRRAERLALPAVMPRAPLVPLRIDVRERPVSAKPVLREP